jgi:hypothetical protein
LTVDVSMGVGNNSIFLPAKWTLDASTMSVAVQGGPLASQKDRLEWNANGALVNGSRYLTTASLLGGNDSLSGIVGIVQPLSIDAGSLVDLRVDAGAGDDSLALRDTSAGFTPAANLVAGVFGASLVGGAGKDVVRIDLDGGVAGAGATRLALDSGAGDDVAIASLRLDASAGTPRFDVAVYGGAGADVLYVASLPDGGPADPVMPLLDGGAGLDACIFSDFTRQVAHLVLDCEMSGY